MTAKVTLEAEVDTVADWLTSARVASNSLLELSVVWIVYWPAGSHIALVSLSGTVPFEVTPYVRIGVMSELLVEIVPFLMVATIAPVLSRITRLVLPPPKIISNLLPILSLSEQRCRTQRIMASISSACFRLYSASWRWISMSMAFFSAADMDAPNIRPPAFLIFIRRSYRIQFSFAKNIGIAIMPTKTVAVASPSRNTMGRVQRMSRTA